MLMVWDSEELKGLKMCIIQQLLIGLKLVGKLLLDCYEPEEIPQVGELDELETFVGSKKTKLGYGQQ